jgi:Mrp family chromosome partitioning ATPase/capsular polysaccharide biosynthesis protein
MSATLDSSSCGALTATTSRGKGTVVAFEDDTPSTLRDYWEIVERRKWIILQAVVLVPLAAVFLALREPSVYDASARVLLDPQNRPGSLLGVDNPVVSDASRVLQTQAELARAPTLATNVVEAARVPGMTASDLLGSSSVSPSEDSDVLTFSVSSSSPRLAAHLATVYAREFTDYRRELDIAEVTRARAVLQRQIAALEDAGEQDSPGYDRLVEREQDLTTIEDLLRSGTDTSSAVLVRPASGATKVQPKPVRNGIIGGILGLVAGLVFAFLGEALDTRVRSVERLGKRLGLPLLARVPKPPRPLRKKRQLAMLAEPSGAHAEAFRVLAANFDLVNHEVGARTIMVTSALEQEGKSTTVCNLALALANAGRRVALVDLDLRNPSLHHFFNLEPSPGLTDAALDRVPLEQAIWRLDVGLPSSLVTTNGATRASDGSVEVLPAGTVPSNVGEFVAGLVLAPTFEQLLQRNDLVLIDGPPLLGLGDAVAASSQVDALVLVARLAFVRDTMLDDLDRILRASPPTTARLGFIATGAKLDRGYGYMTYAHKRQRAGVSRGDQPG